MAKEYAASKTQITKAAEIGIDTADQPGYTTLGARLEAAGWTRDGKTQMSVDDVPLATIALDNMQNRKSAYQLRQERKADRQLWTLQNGDDSRLAGEHPNFQMPVSGGTVQTEDKE